MHRRMVAFMARSESGALAATLSIRALTADFQFTVGHHLVDHPDFVGAPAVDGVGGKQDLAGVWCADDFDQLAGEVKRRRQTDARQRHPEARVFGRDAHVAMQRQFASSSQGRALNRGHRGDRESFQVMEDGFQAKSFAAIGGRHAMPLGKVDSGAEMPSFAGEAQRPHGLVAFNRGQRFFEFGEHLVIDGVAFGGPGQPDRGVLTGALDFDHFHWHSSIE